MLSTSVILLLLLAFAELPHAQSAPNYLNGNWTNALGSHMSLSVISDTALMGEYQTAVGVGRHRNTLPPVTPLYGTYQVTKDGILVSFSVQWCFRGDGKKSASITTACEKNSVTTWAGKLYFERPHEWQAQWLLVGDAPLKAAWGNTRTNIDSFTRDQ